MLRFKMSISLSVLILIGAVGVTIAGSDHPGTSTISAASQPRGDSSSRAQAAAQKTTPFVALSMRGTGTSTFTDGACTGVTCNSSSGGCSCVATQGNLTGTPIGNGSWTSNITINTDDCTNTGTTGPADLSGFCCFGGGVLIAKFGTGTSASTLSMSLTGPVCSDPNDADTNGGATSIQGGFIILTASSTGKFAHSAGSGLLSATVGIDAATTTYLSGNGTMQVVSPF